MNRRKLIQIGDNLYLDNGLENLIVKDILVYYDEPLVFVAENNKQEKYIFSLIEKTNKAVTWLATRIDNEAKEVNAYDIYKKPLDGYVYKIHLFAYQFISKVLPKDIDDKDLADKDVIYKI